MWHPYTSLIDPTPVLPVRRAEKCTIELEDGSKLLDGMVRNFLYSGSSFTLIYLQFMSKLFQFNVALRLRGGPLSGVTTIHSSTKPYNGS